MRRRAEHPDRAHRRVAILIYGLVPGGAERVACALSAAWSARGDDVTVVTMAPPSTDVYALAPGVRRVALDLAGASRGSLAAMRAAARRVHALRRALGALAPDVVVSFMTATNVVCLLATAGTGVPVVVCERTDPRHARPGRAWELLRRALYPRAAAVAVQTEGVAAWTRRFCRRVAVIPNFVERPPRRAAALDPAGPKRLVAIGRLVPAKGFDLLVEAFARIAPSRPDWALEILGEGPERPRLEALARARGLDGRVALPGHVSDPLARLADGQAFVLSSRHEGFPNALLEAMACGLPVVAFDCQSGPRDAITDGHDGVLVAAGDVEALGAALARIMDTPAERIRLGRNAEEVAARLGPERVLPRWSALLESVCPES